jgi:hypothetical protein
MQPCIAAVDQPIPFKSRSVDWGSGETGLDFPVDCLDKAVKGMDNPFIEDILIRIAGTFTTVASTGSARGMLLAQMLDKIQFSDEDGPRVDCRGSSLRIQLCMEYGTELGFRELRNQGAGATVAFVVYYRIPTCSPETAENKRDYRWDARRMRNGGQVTIACGTSPFGPSANYQATITGTPTLEIHYNVVDEHRKRDPSRMILRDWVIYSSDQTFPLGADNGTKVVKLRSAIQYIGQVGESKATPDAWSSQRIDSRVLQLFHVRDDYLLETFFARRSFNYPDAAGVVATVDPFYNDYALALYTPMRRQQITEMADCGSFDWQTDLTFGSGTFTSSNQPRMIFTFVDDNPAILCGSKAGSVHLAAAGPVPVGAVQDKLQAKLPRVYAVAGSAANKA